MRVVKTMGMDILPMGMFIVPLGDCRRSVLIAGRQERSYAEYDSYCTTPRVRCLISVASLLLNVLQACLTEKRLKSNAEC